MNLILIDLLSRIDPSPICFYLVFIEQTLRKLMFVYGLLLDIDSCSLIYQDCEADAPHHA